VPITRRTANMLLAATAAISPVASGGTKSKRSHRYDVAVIGAGSFGAWTAHHLQRSGLRTLLVDAYGPSNSRASSGGESRIIRTSYGDQDFYSGWAWQSLPEWKALERRTGQTIFTPTGVLVFGGEGARFLAASHKALADRGIPHQMLGHDELRHRFPQLALRSGEVGLLEPAAGALFARRAIQALVADSIRHGLEYRQVAVAAPRGEGARAIVETTTAEPIDADRFVYACGPWLRTVFATELGGHLRADRAEVYFLGVPAGDGRFAGTAFPAWMDVNDGAEAWGIPDLENRGFKLAVDKLTIPADPDRMNREPTPEFLALVRSYVAERFPLLVDAPVVETRVCQYEMTPNEEYLVDRHPRFANVWWAGGGSGHGFKTGPAVGAYVASVVRDAATIDPRFQRGKPA